MADAAEAGASRLPAVVTAPRPRESLVRRTLWQIAIRIGIVVALVSALGYWHVKRSVEGQAVEALQRYINERQERESIAFTAINQSLDYLALRLERQLDTTDRDPRFRFGMIFNRTGDGTMRIRESLFQDEDITGFIGKTMSPDEHQQSLLVAATDLLRELGPSYPGRFSNAYVITPDSAVVMFWPGEAWARDAAEWEIFSKITLASSPAEGGVVVVGRDPSPPASGVAWSNVYFDYGANQWMVSALRPVVHAGETVAFVGHDLLLDDLFERVLHGGLPTSENILMTDDGTLIVHPRYMDAIEAHGGLLNVADVDAPDLALLHQTATTTPPGDVRHVAGLDALVAVAQLPGPNWHLLTVIPERLVTMEARTVALLILLGGVCALLVELLILWTTLRHRVGMPLARLATAAREVGAGDFNVKVDTDRPDELGDLARAFAGMTVELDKRRNKLAHRHAQLARLNDQLAEQLESRRQTEAELARHRELNVLLDAIDYGVMFLDADLRIRLANRAYRELWHVPTVFYSQARTLLEDMEASQAAGLYGISDEQWPAYLEARLAEVRAGDFGPVELELTNGTVMQYRVHALPDGGRMLTYFDLTPVMEADALLRKHRAGMEASMDGIALFDADGGYFYVNRAHAAIYGFDSAAEMIGQSWQMLYEPDELQRFETEIIPKLAADGAWQGEAIGRRRNGELFPQELSLALTPDGGIVCVIRDITSRRQREEALALALAHAEEANTAKSRFLANMSHELRTPLNAVIGFARIVKRKTEGTIPPLQTENLGKILSSGEHLLNLINDMLDLARIEAGRLDLVYRPYAPASLADETVRTVEPMTRPGVALRRTGADPSAAAVGDVDKIRQILLNLVGNAAKFTVAGEIVVDVTITADRVAFAVRDTGPGIEPALHDRIFEEFARAGRPPGLSQGSTGLGLAISQRLAELMDGAITLESTVGQGSTFTLVLPAQPTAAGGLPTRPPDRDEDGAP